MKKLKIASIIAGVIVITAGLLFILSNSDKVKPAFIEESMQQTREGFLWGFVCETLQPLLSRPQKAKFARVPEEFKELEDNWYLITGEVEIVNDMGIEFKPLVKARIKFYPHGSDIYYLDVTPYGKKKSDSTYNDWVIESMTLGGDTIFNYAKENAESRKWKEEANKKN